MVQIVAALSPCQSVRSWCEITARLLSWTFRTQAGIANCTRPGDGIPGQVQHLSRWPGYASSNCRSLGIIREFKDHTSLVDNIVPLSDPSCTVTGSRPKDGRHCVFHRRLTRVRSQPRRTTNCTGCPDCDPGAIEPVRIDDAERR